MKKFIELVKQNLFFTIFVSVLLAGCIIVKCTSNNSVNPKEEAELNAKQAVENFMRKDTVTFAGVKKMKVTFSEFESIENYSEIANPLYISAMLRTSLLERIIYNASSTTENERRESLEDIIKTIKSYAGMKVDDLSAVQQQELALFSDIYYWLQQVQGKDVTEGVLKLKEKKMQYESNMAMLKQSGYRCVGEVRYKVDGKEQTRPFNIVMTTGFTDLYPVEERK